MTTRPRPPLDIGFLPGDALSKLKALAEDGNIDTIKQLIAAGADVNNPVQSQPQVQPQDPHPIVDPAPLAPVAPAVKQQFVFATTRTIPALPTAKFSAPVIQGKKGFTF